MHVPVLLKEVIEYLDPKPGDQIIDATLDGGGHTKGILEKCPDVKILGIEVDPVIFQEFKSEIQSASRRTKFENRIILVNDSYVNIEKIAREHNFRPNGILFDLGLSSWHYERSGRGFSFRKEDEPLDMRFSPTGLKSSRFPIRQDQGPVFDSEGRALRLRLEREFIEGQEPSSKQTLTAAEIVNTYSREELERIFEEYGEEQFAESIAENIVSARKMKLIMTVGDLVEVIRYSVPDWYKKRKIHFATKTFQALRIAVNDELKNVSDGVSSAIDVLIPGGRLAVISFHGVEDKVVRELFKKRAKEGMVKFVVKGTVKPSWEEIKNNPRSRSAKMKIIEKI